MTKETKKLSRGEALEIERKNFVSKYSPTKYSPKLCDELIATMNLGNSRTHFCADNNICYRTFDNWRERYPEFDAAYRKGLTKSERWWRDVAQDHLTQTAQGTQVNSVLWSMNMRNRFGWTEHRCVEIHGMAKADSFKEKFDLLSKSLESGKLTSTELSSVANVLTAGLKIAESSEMLERIEHLEELLQDKTNGAVS